MDVDADETVAAVLTPLLRALELLALVARHLHPPISRSFSTASVGPMTR